MTNTAEHIGEPITPLDTILQRLGGRSGFPALTTTITDINRIVGSDSDSVRKLTQTILRDVSFTNKMLQVVNSATYGQFRGRIHTISKAVLILGFDAVRSVAMSLLMLEFSKGSSQAKTMQDEIISAFFAGVVSKPLCQQLQLRNIEEGVICTMFQSLGKLLTTFFFYEEGEQIRGLVETGMNEEAASHQVLGISYRDLGVGVAKHWNFPDRLIQGMQTVTPRDIKQPGTDAEKLCIAANLASELCATALHTSEADKPAALQALAKRYAVAIKVDAKELNAAINSGLEEIAERALTLNISVTNNQKLNTIKTWAGNADESKPSTAVNQDPATDPLLQDVNALDATVETQTITHNPEQILSAGIRDVTETLVTEFAINDILQMVLETMYRGMDFSRTLVFIRDAKLNTMRARFGFGEHIEQIIQKCVFPLAFAPDVFHVALDKGVDIVIDDALAPNIVSRIPQWHRQAMPAKSFLLLPIVVKNQTIGLFYADSEESSGIKVDTKQLGLLRTLRNQVVIAFKQKM
ncbi:MAG: HDOD domain-containing protein [Steroidobacteraceae bacterium]